MIRNHASPDRIREQINRLVAFLVDTGLADDQEFAFQKGPNGKVVQIIFRGHEHLSAALKNRDYREIHSTMTGERAYNVKMLDGALIQMTYEFVDTSLQRHRLAFFPSPILDEFQQDPDIYLDDEIHGDITSRKIIPFPLRFDYDSREDSYEELVHPKSHLSLGQYLNCRIPVTSPLTPVQFVDFVLRNFYDTKQKRYTEDLPRNNCSFTESISSAERDVVHIAVPT
ncbi:MAG: DUF2290 domain-containing protein [Rhodothermaceae bacterium]|nr:DUF2290 domain-containing protein [Bacteroidota bacterium]MXW33043.1 DUF2290 domain-containing protein [Rhodothermaceae bacterium]MYE63912.1 DUF2290 domain-containing protein [Rhodothermaceae bacterium]MYJ19954.1 DUF2290 domain-containing protein [Rhodothermaceae bacterium]